MVLRHRGLQVTTYGLTYAPYRNSDLVEELGVRYVATPQTSLVDDVAAHGQYDLVFEATGYSPIVFDAMCHTVARNGILVLASVTRGCTAPRRRSAVAADHTRHHQGVRGDRGLTPDQPSRGARCRLVMTSMDLDGVARHVDLELLESL